VIVVVAETRGGVLARPAVEAIAAAQQAGGPVQVVLPAAEGGTAAAELAGFDVAEVVVLRHDALGDYTADGFTAALVSHLRADASDLVIFPHTYQTRDYAPRVAARLDAPLVTDCIALRTEGAQLVLTRPMFQGKVHADVAVNGPGPHLVAIQVGAWRADAARRGSQPAATRVEVARLDPAAIRQRPEPPFREAKQAVDLTQAERIVSVGRGIKEQSHIALVEKLAHALGAEVAASRPICDAGWLPMDRQIGSSGQTVAPRLYVAVGISGAIQHIVGMKGARTIVAINKDADAPIFEIADYGIVGDLFEVVPALIAALP
jgi:electron transfer flavoprotein alpha subunit